MVFPSLLPLKAADKCPVPLTHLLARIQLARAPEDKPCRPALSLPAGPTWMKRDESYWGTSPRTTNLTSLLSSHMLFHLFLKHAYIIPPPAFVLVVPSPRTHLP